MRNAFLRRILPGARTGRLGWRYSSNSNTIETVGTADTAKSSIVKERYRPSKCMIDATTKVPVYEDNIYRGTGRVNIVGIQQISEHIHKQLFTERVQQMPEELRTISASHLKRHGLQDRKCTIKPEVNFNLPLLQGMTLDEHFRTIGEELSRELISRARYIARADVSHRPEKWILQSGWTRYAKGMNPEKVDVPLEKEYIFDVETLYHQSQFPIFGTAVSAEAWYCWISPWLLEEDDNPRHLLSFGNENRLLVGHHVGYDRARVKEEYHFNRAIHNFIDTMSLHIALNGMCNSQRTVHGVVDTADILCGLNGELSAESQEGAGHWAGRTSKHSLKNVVAFYKGKLPDKKIRDTFGFATRKEIRDSFQKYAEYCSEDVRITHSVYQSLLEQFLIHCSHPVSFFAMVKLNSLYLPTSKKWEEFMERCERKHQEMLGRADEILAYLTEKAIDLRYYPHIYKEDLWYKQLDWSSDNIKMIKDKSTGALRPAKRHKYLDLPKWYKELCSGSLIGAKLTMKSRIAPYLLKLSWEGHAIKWCEDDGWIFKVEEDEIERYIELLYTPAHPEIVDENDETEKGFYFKLPHYDGSDGKCMSPIGKQYFKYLENGQLSSPLPEAREVLNIHMNSMYWIGVRERLDEQLIVWNDELDYGLESSERLGAIIPQTICMGTTTRRAVEKTWLTTSDAKMNKLGSESKAMIEAPDGYCFVGADVDSEELWIAAVIGDSQFKVHGATALGWMTLEGSKDDGTDLHSKTAGILGVSRSDAKIFNYGRIYGAGMRFAARLLQEKNPHLSTSKANAMANKLYEETKGIREKVAEYLKPQFWRGGTESYSFNKLDDFALDREPRTPILGAKITSLLNKKLVAKDFMTSRVNWAIQSSGVDYLHLLLASMEYLIQKYNINARLTIAIHDEIRFLSSDKDKHRTAMALQISNLWVRGIFCQKLGIYDIPQSCAFFSTVDIDNVLRKDVTMSCVTPSNPTPIPPGQCLTIEDLLEKDDYRLVPAEQDKPNFLEQNVINWQKGSRKDMDMSFLRLQSTRSLEEAMRVIDDFNYLMETMTREDLTDEASSLNLVWLSMKKVHPARLDLIRKEEVSDEDIKKGLLQIS